MLFLDCDLSQGRSSGSTCYGGAKGFTELPRAIEAAGTSLSGSEHCTGIFNSTHSRLRLANKVRILTTSLLRFNRATKRVHYNPMKSLFFQVTAAVAFAALLALPQVALAASTFYGITVHVSTNNIKVRNPKTHQTLSFEILPKFDKIFSANGKTTYQMRAIKPGHYVGIIYDQKAFGIRHADKIYILNNANLRISSP